MLSPVHLDEDERRIFRQALAGVFQALAGMFWSKQHYPYYAARCLEQPGVWLFSGEQGQTMRNAEWLHVANDGVISTPDKCEYPWLPPGNRDRIARSRSRVRLPSKFRQVVVFGPQIVRLPSAHICAMS